jgi:hypothetical protein
VNTFFEITDWDFECVAEAHGLTLAPEQVESMCGDEALIARLLEGVDNLVDLQDQTNAIYREMEQVFRERGLIPPGDTMFPDYEGEDEEDEEDEEDD